MSYFMVNVCIMWLVIEKIKIKTKSIVTERKFRKSWPTHDVMMGAMDNFPYIHVRISLCLVLSRVKVDTALMISIADFFMAKLRYSI